tara:strand:+ start:29 stop:406 length:378 start_codon:yes stop_codon:yes gene_type:complete
MSTLAVGTIKSISSAAPVFQNTSGVEKGQLAKVWITFNSSTVVQDSFGVSSLSDNGNGDFNVNFSTNFSNDDYCSSTMAAQGDNCAFTCVDSSQSVSTCRVITRTDRTSGKTDFTMTHAIFFGDN